MTPATIPSRSGTTTGWVLFVKTTNYNNLVDGDSNCDIDDDDIDAIDDDAAIDDDDDDDDDDATQRNTHKHDE